MRSIISSRGKLHGVEEKISRWKVRGFEVTCTEGAYGGNFLEFQVITTDGLAKGH
jgi:hypothetical protein